MKIAVAGPGRQRHLRTSRAVRSGEATFLPGSSPRRPRRIPPVLPSSRPRPTTSRAMGGPKAGPTTPLPPVPMVQDLYQAATRVALSDDDFALISRLYP